MPALNVKFTAAELDHLRKRARDEGVSMRTIAHDTIVSSNRQAAEYDLIWDAYQRAKITSAELLASLADK